jgi:hypothetical protein
MLGFAAPAVAQADAKPETSAREAKKARPRKLVSAAHKKALSELYGGFKFGMTKDQVIAVFSKQLDERYV